MRAVALTRSLPAWLPVLILSVSLGCGDGGGGGPVQPMPTISLTLGSPTAQVNAGSSGTATVTVGRGGGYAGAVALAAEGAPTGVTVTFSPASVPNGSATSALSIAAAASTVPGNYSLTIRGTGSGVSPAVAQLALTVAPKPAIALGVTPTGSSVVQGASGTAAVAITRTNFAGDVSFAVTGAPAGVTAGVSPASTATNAAQLTMDVGGAVAPGVYTLTVTGQGQGIDPVAATFALTVLERSIALAAADPASLTLNRGASGSTQLRLTRTNYAGDATFSVSGAPAGVTATFAPAATTTGTEVTLTLQPSDATPLGAYDLTVTAQAPGLTSRTAALRLTVLERPAIQLTVTPTPLTVPRGTSGSATVRIARTNFAGAVTVAVTGAPAGVTVTPSPSSATGNSVTLTVDVASTAALGGSALTITAQGQGVSQATATLDLTVTPRELALAADPSSVSVDRGKSRDVQLLLTRTNFPGDVALSVSGAPTGVTASITPGATSGNAATLSIQVTDAAPLGPHTLTVTGQAAGLGTRTATVTLTVLERPAIALALSAARLTIKQGANGSATVTIARTNFTGDVALSVTGAPTGVTATASPTPTTGNSATVSVDVGAAVTPGSYQLTVTGQGAAGTPSDAEGLELVVDPAYFWTQVSAGVRHSCGITTDAKAYCWGYNTSGQLGIGSQVNQSRPTLVAGGLSWSQVSAGTDYTCGITTGGVAYCWGTGATGQLGNGGNSAVTTTPQPVSVSGGDRWASITTAVLHTCALTTEGKAWCWGANYQGQLGDGTRTWTTTRVAVAGDRTWRSLDAGGWGFAGGSLSGVTCGVTTAGEAFCWGSNFHGQLGNGTPASGSQDDPHSTPLAVSGGRLWTSISVGAYHACGVAADGSAYCWGDNTSGELGTGNTTPQTTPALVLNNLTFASVDAGNDGLGTGLPPTTCGLTTTGAAYCWGANGLGQVGNANSSATQTAPAQVSGSRTWTLVSSGGEQACGRATTGILYCWGRGTLGQLGNGTTGSSLTPVLVLDPQ